MADTVVCVDDVDDEQPRRQRRKLGFASAAATQRYAEAPRCECLLPCTALSAYVRVVSLVLPSATRG